MTGGGAEGRQPMVVDGVGKEYSLLVEGLMMDCFVAEHQWKRQLMYCASSLKLSSFETMH
jgi:hypothetical protein